MVEPPDISQELVDAELDRLMDSPALRRAPSHMRLLRYLVTRRLAGDAGALRETAIALEVFRRDPSTYDPQTDPIVRVTTRRLRERLDVHYATQAAPVLRIVLPKGRYAPEFVTRAVATPRERTLLVLRTANQTGDPALDPRCEALAERLRDHLAQAGVPRLRGPEPKEAVLAKTGAAARSALDVAWLLESTLAREREDELRLSVRLLEGEERALRWVETAVARTRDLVVLCERMLDLALTRTLDTLPLPVAMGAAGASLAGSEPRGARVAVDQAQLMLAQRNLRFTDDAVALAESAAHGHPHDADAWATLAAARLSRHTFMDRDGVLLADVHAAIDRALALSPEHPVALRTLAIVTGKRDHDAFTAEELFRRALRSMPHYTSARINLAELFALQGKAAEALAELNLARVYDPLSPSVLLARAVCLDTLRMYDAGGEAWALCEATGEASLWVLCGVGTHRLLTGKLAEAAVSFEEAARRHPTSPQPLMGEAYVLAAEGRTTAARAAEQACIARFPHAGTAARAVLAGYLGERERVCELLAQAHASHDMELIQAAIHPALDAFARDADVAALLPFGCYVGLRS